MILCDNAVTDPDRPNCTHIDCMMGMIRSMEDPAYPVVRESFYVFLVLANCRGAGNAQIKVLYQDEEPERLILGSLIHTLDFSGSSPLDLLGVGFRIRNCRFPFEGRYSVQFWYNERCVSEQPLTLR